MSAAARVLVVDDDETIRLAVATALRAEGFVTDTASDGFDLASRLAAFRPDLVVLDWMMPGPSGIRLLPVVREAGDTAVIMLTARDDVDDRLRGFAEGADDYVVKPFTMAELVARAGAVLRRRGRLPQTISVGDLIVDPDAATAHRAGAALDLTATEFRLLHLLVDGRGRTLSKAQILTQVWGYDDYDPNLVEVHLSALRRKMEQHGPRLIHTVRGLGYRLSASP
ncbi:response regulator transcription factor [Microbacterium sp. VKM Ac-2923]|uniref:response regulator transcription factor n=1 Tax=Microbacterium sp. VKM Ac-2923 TaxID=2929476 RepID=UPI001FB3320F|nr:response regulator transcription factor [Microbacterium sp. VKM Ac-2923]MCJ1707435.1 response regulator transcription factor [Microbacterium sp. VKM Ac-2923]